MFEKIQKLKGKFRSQILYFLKCKFYFNEGLLLKWYKWKSCGHQKFFTVWRKYRKGDCSTISLFFNSLPRTSKKMVNVTHFCLWRQWWPAGSRWPLCPSCRWHTWGWRSWSVCILRPLLPSCFDTTSPTKTKNKTKK